MISICLVYRIFTFREFKPIHKGKTAIFHLCFGTEKNRRLGSKKARYIRAFRRRHLFCLHIMVRATGLEPARRRRKILNLMRLPIPPCPHRLSIAYPTGKCKKFLKCVALLVVCGPVNHQYPIGKQMTSRAITGDGKQMPKPETNAGAGQ